MLWWRGKAGEETYSSHKSSIFYCTGIPSFIHQHCLCKLRIALLSVRCLSWKSDSDLISHSSVRLCNSEQNKCKMNTIELIDGSRGESFVYNTCKGTETVVHSVW